MDNKWECFSLIDAQITVGQVTDLLNQIESQGYEPKFLQTSITMVNVYGRKKDVPQLSSQMELPLGL